MTKKEAIAKIAKEVKTSVEKKYKIPSKTEVGIGYTYPEYTYVLAKAIEDAGSTDKAAIKTAIQKVNLVGITGNITFDANGNPQRDVPIIQIVDGEYVLKTKVTAGKEE